MSKTEPNYKVLVASLLPILTACAMIRRFHFGVDITDESFYIATTRSIIEWGGPFVMNVNPTQLSSLLTTPFLLLYRSFVPDDSSVIIASRFLYLAMTALTAVCFFDFARRRTSTPLALLLSAVPLAWMPFSLPACSYHTFVTNFFSMALLILVTPPAISSKRAIISAIFFFLTVIGYPTLVVPVATFYLALFLSASELGQKRTILTSLATLAAISCLFAASLLATIGSDPILKCLAWTRSSVDASKTSKISFWLSQFEHMGLLCRLTLANVSAFCIHRSSNAWLRLTAALTFTGTCLYTAFVRSAPLYYQSHELILLLALSGIFYFNRQVWLEDPKVSVAFWSSIFAAVITHLTGTNGLLNSPLGATAAALIALTYLCKSLHQFSFVPPVLVVSIVGGMIFDFSDTVYGEWLAANEKLTFKIRSGPYKGIFTAAKRGEIITELQNDLHQYSAGNSTIYIIGAPGYYLLSQQKALEPFLYHINDRQSQVPFMQKFFSDEKNRPDVIVHVFSDEYFGKSHAADDALLKTFYVKSKENSNYVIYTKRR